MIAQAVFLLERRQTDRQTDADHATECHTHAGGYIAGVGKEEKVRKEVK